MVRNMGIARDLGLLHIPPGLVVSLDDAMTLPPEQLVLMSTGSQGEPMSALGRMSTGDHRHIAIAPGDTVVLASSLVPGNETAVYRVINQLSRAGAMVVHKDIAKVHVSGHSPAGELLYLLNVVRPSNFMPVHGEWRHLRAHARLGIESGIPEERVVICEDGDVVDLVEGQVRLAGHIRSRYVYVDGLAVGDVGESLLTERRILGDGGFIACTVVVDSVTGKVVGGPTVSAKGFSEDASVFEAVLPVVTEALDRAAADGITDPHQLQQVVRRTIGRWVNDKYRRRPMIVPNVVEV
jgi:ribonuclease J